MNYDWGCRLKSHFFLQKSWYGAPSDRASYDYLKFILIRIFILNNLLEFHFFEMSQILTHIEVGALKARLLQYEIWLHLGATLARLRCANFKKLLNFVM